MRENLRLINTTDIVWRTLKMVRAHRTSVGYGAKETFHVAFLKVPRGTTTIKRVSITWRNRFPVLVRLPERMKGSRSKTGKSVATGYSSPRRRHVDTKWIQWRRHLPSTTPEWYCSMTICWKKDNDNSKIVSRSPNNRKKLLEENKTLSRNFTTSII